MMLTKRSLALFAFCALLCAVALVKHHVSRRVDVDTEQTTAISATAESTLSPDLLGQHANTPERNSGANEPQPAKRSSVATVGAPDHAVYLESTGVIERLQKSRHDFYSPVVKGVPQRVTYRFTLDRQPLAELASQQATVAWPVNDGGVEFVKLTTLREQDGNLFISGEVVDGQGQFVMVMSKDNSMSGHLLSPRGMHSYNSQLDEIVGQRVEGPVHFD